MTRTVDMVTPVVTKVQTDTDILSLLQQDMQQLAELYQQLRSIDESLSLKGILDGTLCSKFYGTTPRLYVRKPSSSPDKKHDCTYLPSDLAARSSAVAAHERGQLQREVRRLVFRQDKRMAVLLASVAGISQQVRECKALLVDAVDSSTTRYRTIEHNLEKSLATTGRFHALREPRAAYNASVSDYHITFQTSECCDI